MAPVRSYSRSASISACENLPPKTLARVGREIRDLHKGPPEGVRLVVDSDTGVPSNLGEVLVSAFDGALLAGRHGQSFLFFDSCLQRLLSRQKCQNVAALCDSFSDFVRR